MVFVIEGNDRNDAVFPSDLFYSIIIRDGRRVLLEGEKDIDLHLQIQKLHMMITH